MTNIAGILFDMDGVLLDTEEAMLQATIRGFADYGVTVQPEDFTPFFGTGSKGYFGGVGEKYGISYSPELSDYMYDKFLEVIDNEAIRYPGVVRELARLHGEGYKLAIASSAAKKKVLANIRTAGINPAHIDYLVTEDDITRNKPDPEIFLKAAEGLGLSPSQCIVVEDSVSGIKAGVAAGMRCVGVRGTYPDDLLLAAGAWKIVDHLPSETRTWTLREALAADPKENYRFRCEGGRVRIFSDRPYEEAHRALMTAGIYYDRLSVVSEKATYNLYGRRLD